MNCPVCDHADSRVLHTLGPKRRRQCCHCFHRWTTVELMEVEARAAHRVREIAAQLLADLPARG